jgi:hypothetical protein
MTQRPGDHGPPAEGGHAAERLRQFREARQPTAPAPDTADDQPRAPSERERRNDEKSDVQQDGDNV